MVCGLAQEEGVQEAEIAWHDKAAVSAADWANKLTEAHRELAVRTALSNGWEQDVKLLRAKVQELEQQNKNMADAMVGLKERSALAAGKELALQAACTARVATLNEELRACKHAGDAAVLEKAKVEASLKVRIDARCKASGVVVFAALRKCKAMVRVHLPWPSQFVEVLAFPALLSYAGKDGCAGTNQQTRGGCQGTGTARAAAR